MSIRLIFALHLPFLIPDRLARTGYNIYISNALRKCTVFNQNTHVGIYIYEAASP